MEYIIINEDINELSIELKQIYYSAIIEQEYELSNKTFIETISEVIEQNNETLHSFTMMNSEASFSIDFDEELVLNFLKKIDFILQDISETAYKFNEKFQNSCDIMAIIVPYALGKMNVTNDDVLLFLGLAIGISKIVVRTISDKYDKFKNEKNQNKELQDICLLNLELLENLKETKETQEYTEKIKRVLDRLD